MMKSFTTIQKQITDISIGGFDGMHLAHQKLFSKIDPKNGAIIVIETGYANLTPHKNRENYSYLPIYYYDLQDIKHLSGKEFIELLYSTFPKLSKIVVGYDFAFGKDRAYNITSLKEIFKGEIVVVDELSIDGIAVHSRTIRAFLKEGNIKSANKLLGKNYSIKGNVISGQGLGKKQFVATLNLDVNEFLIPKEGIYATKTTLNVKTYNSVSFIGHRVSTDGKYAIETHIIDKTIDFSGGEVSIEFIDKIRDNKKFDNLLELKAQILDDIQIAKKTLISIH